MKTLTLSCALLAGCLVASASAQRPTLVRGHKVLLDKNGRVVPAPAHPTLPPAPLVGGADSCVSPDVITGLGSFAFDNSVATTGAEGQNEQQCFPEYQVFGIDNDVWFTWTAPYTGGLQVDTCTSFDDTKIAAYAGSTCPTPGSALDCNDDTCGFESQITIAVTAGNSYVIQLGDFPGTTGGTGVFTLSQVAPPPPPPTNDDCTSPIAISGPGTYPFDNTNASSSSQQSSSCPVAENDSWWAYTPASTGSATISTCGLITSFDDDTVIAVYPGSTCPSGNELGCDDDASCGVQSEVTWPITCGSTYMIQVGAWDVAYQIAGSFSITETGTQCGPTGTAYCFGDGTGTACPCGNTGSAGNGCASSVNASGANLTTTGAANLANDTLVLHGSGMPDSSCLYFQGTTQISTVFGDGLRCAGGTVVRLGTKTNSGGASQYPGAGNASVSVKGAVTAPGARTYQTWYRNAAAFCTPSTFNLTNGILVTWQ